MSQARSLESLIDTANASGQGGGIELCERKNLKRKRACITHMQRVRERYGTLLARFGCICRNLISQNLEPCCKESRISEVIIDKRQINKTCGAEARGACCGDAQQVDSSVGKSYCSEKTGAKQERRNCGSDRGSDRGREEKSSCGAGPFESCSQTVVQSYDEANPMDKCCASEVVLKEEKTSCDDGVDCCESGARIDQDETHSTSGKEKGEHVSPPTTARNRKVATTQMTRTALGIEHIMLYVEGMTCSGCETKLKRAIDRLPGTTAVKTSFVMLQAEFDLDITTISVEAAIQSLETATGFKCERRRKQGQEIEVTIDGNVKSFMNQTYPPGVIEMTAVDNRTVCIAYDAQVIGARDLVQHTRFNLPAQLAPPRGLSDVNSGKNHARRMLWSTLLSTALTIPVLVMAWAPLPARPITYGSASLALATIVQVMIAGPFYPSTLRSLILAHVIEVDLLIVLSTTAAYVFSVVAFAYTMARQPLSTGSFFETSTLLVTLIMLGRLVSAVAKQKAVESVSIKSLQAESAIICSAQGGLEQPIDVRLLQYGDYFKVTPDSRLPTDGIVVSGITEVDESLVTGESRPITKAVGTMVIAGSINMSGVIVVRLTHLPNDNTISNISAMVDEAKFGKAKTQEIVDIVAGYFVPVILIICVITFAAWMGIGVGVRHYSGGDAAANAITYAVSVLIVSCPCAIGLAVPMVLVIAGGVAAKHGIIVKSPLAFETGRLMSHVVFDKTGTLTEGRLDIKHDQYPTRENNLAMSLALCLTKDSKHPVSAAIAKHLSKLNIASNTTLDAVESIAGKGMEGWMGGVRVRCGNTRWLNIDEHESVKPLLARGLTVCAITMGDRIEPVAIFGLADFIRPEAASVIADLRARDIKSSILSGDDAGAVEAVAAELGIPVENVRSRCTPADKLEYLKTIMAAGDKVLFCGDGANDAAALAQADIGLHINTGSEIASTAAGAVLVRPHLEGVLTLLDLSKAAFRRIMFNFAWSFIYNLFAILLASGAFVDARIPPEFAGLGEIASVLPVIATAWQLRWFKAKTVLA